MAWYLVRPLVNFRNQLNAIAPNRDKASDGIIGDYAHSQGRSGHNPDDTSQNNAEWDGDADSIQDVRAIDVDEDFRTPGLSAEELVRYLVLGCRSGRFWFIRYIIYEGVIYHKNTGYAARAYTGSNRHDHHFHISSDWSESADDANPDYQLEGLIPVALDNTDKAWLTAEIDRLSATAGEVWAAEVNPGDGRRSLATVTVDLYNVARATQVAQAQASQAILAAIQNNPSIDANQVANMLAPQVVAGVVAAMDAQGIGDGGITTADVEDALRGIFGDAATP